MNETALLWDFEDPAGSEERFRAAAAEVTGERRELLLTQVARALGLQRRFAEGFALLDGLTGPTPEVRARVELERGRLLRSEERPGEARPHFETAARVAIEAHQAELAVEALHLVALVVPEDERIDADLRALDVARTAHDAGARDRVAALLHEVGADYAEAGAWETAISYFEEALEARERTGHEARIEEARSALDWAREQFAEQDDEAEDTWAEEV